MRVRSVCAIAGPTRAERLNAASRLPEKVGFPSPRQARGTPEAHFLDKAALLKAIKEAEAKAAKDLEEAQAKRQSAIAAGQAEAERVKREGLAAVDEQVASQVADARRRI